MRYSAVSTRNLKYMTYTVSMYALCDRLTDRGHKRIRLCQMNETLKT